MPRACDRCTIHIYIYIYIFLRFNHRPKSLVTDAMKSFLHWEIFIYIYDLFSSITMHLYLDAYFLYSRERNGTARNRKLTEICNFPHDSARHDCSKSFWRSLNRHHAVGHRQVFPHRVPSMLRLLQSDVLDHLSPHQRRSCGRSRAARGGEVNDDVAALRIKRGEERRRKVQGQNRTFYT